MTAPLLRVIAWRRFHPLSRYGYDVTRQALRRRDSPAALAGVAFVLAGLALRRRATRDLRRTPIYRADLTPGDSMQVRILEDGVEIDVIDVLEA